MAQIGFIATTSGYASDGGNWSTGTSSIIQGSAALNNYYGLMFFDFAAIRAYNTDYFANEITVELKSHVGYARTVRLFMGGGMAKDTFSNVSPNNRPTVAAGTTYKEVSCPANGYCDIDTQDSTWLAALVNPATTCLYINRGDDNASYWEGDGAKDSGTEPTLIVDWLPRPTAPTSIVATPSIHNTGNETLTITGATGDIQKYEIQVATSADNVTWGGYVALGDNNAGIITTTAGSISPTTGAVNLSQGQYTRYRVRVRSTGDRVITGWTYSNIIHQNSPPPAPTIVFPTAGGITYNTIPRIGVITGTDTDGQAQEIGMTIGANSANTVDASPSYFSRTGTFGASQALLEQGLSAAAGSHSVSAFANDGMVTGGSASRSFMVATPPWASDPLTADVTVPGAHHFNDLFTAVNYIRAYYGLAAYSFTNNPMADGDDIYGQAATNLRELRAAIQAVATYINSFDTQSSSHDVPAYSWTDALLSGTEYELKIRHINELRAAIAAL